MVVLPTVGANIPFCVEAIVSGNDTPDKMEKTGWTLVKSETVDAPVIDELPITLECRLEEMNQYDQTYRVVAEIVTIQAMWQLKYYVNIEKVITIIPRITRIIPVALFKVLGVALLANTAAILAHNNVNTIQRIHTVKSGIPPMVK